MSTFPRLTVGLPVYNGARYLAESLDALLGQTFTDFDLVISDNASTDGTADICQAYALRDSRLTYIRQPQNIGMSPNRNFVIAQARGELLKMVSQDDLSARDYLKSCVEVLDERPDVVAAHCREAMIDSAGMITGIISYSPAASPSSGPERFRSMLLDGSDRYTRGVMRISTLLRTRLHRSHHFADRTISIELGFHGPFYQVPDVMYFRRDEPERPDQGSVRSRCASLDPRRASPLRHPVARLYAEYVWAYVAAIHSAPLRAQEKRECYRYLSRWLGSRAFPGALRAVSRSARHASDPTVAALPGLSVTAAEGEPRQARVSADSAWCAVTDPLDPRACES